jgi:hypothetical protein
MDAMIEVAKWTFYGALAARASDAHCLCVGLSVT